MTRMSAHADLVSCTACPVRRLALFRPFSHEELMVVSSLRTGMRHFERGDHIVRPDDEADELFTLFTGWAKRYRVLEDSSVHIPRFYLPGDFIDVTSALTRDHRHYVDCITPVTVCVFRRQARLESLTEHPRLGISLSWLSGREAAASDEALLAASHLTAFQRVGGLLLELYERMRLRDAVSRNTCRLPLRQQDIADHLGLSTEHVNRVLSELRQRGLASIAQRQLTIPDVGALSEAAEWEGEYLTPRPLF